jgi:hypothetical protein
LALESMRKFFSRHFFARWLHQLSHVTWTITSSIMLGQLLLLFSFKSNKTHRLFIQLHEIKHESNVYVYRCVIQGPVPHSIYQGLRRSNLTTPCTFEGIIINYSCRPSLLDTEGSSNPPKLDFFRKSHKKLKRHVLRKEF